MDHIPHPQNATLPPLKIPYLCEDVERYDGLGLRDFPLRKGWTTTSPSAPWSRQYVARAQSWFYFGLLKELLGHYFDRKDFVDLSVDGGQYVTTHRLPALLKDQCQEMSRLYTVMASLGFRDISERGLLRGRPYVRLDERLRNALQLAEQQSHRLDAGDSLACAIVFSIKILIWSIQNALGTYLPSRTEINSFSPRPSRLLKARMLEGGKCHYWTEIYNRNYSTAMIYYLAVTPSMDEHVEHKGCPAEQCIAYDIDSEQYTTRHVNNDCHCSMTAPDLQMVTSIIENDGVPLICFKELSSGRLALDVIQAKYGQHYTAISHVWSGGLGNPSSNSLPQCQLKNIRRGMDHLL